MGRFLNTVKAIAARDWVKWGLLPVAAIAAVGSVISASTPPAIPAVNLAAEPLYARGARAKPTLTLALSVEFPTVGAQYVDVPAATSDASYAPTNEYVGYFNAESCYTYNSAPTETRPTGVPVEDYRRFDRSGDAARDAAGLSLRTCGGAAFSGNYLNWATSSAIDILRFGLTGGDRVVDTATLTVLQRAYLPNTSVVGNAFWNSSNFPSKRLLAAHVPGAVPNAIRGTYNGDIYAANCYNRVHFGTEATGSCAAPGNNSNLGTPTVAAGPVTDYLGALPSDFSAACAAENGTCTFADKRQVAYGYGNFWKFKTVTGGTACTNGVFGDPLVGTAKACYTRAVAPGTELTPDSFFYTRVSVCGSDGSGSLTDPRTSLCLRYPNGNYKPVGNLQKYSDRVRVAAFGYLNESGLARYGGVLRAPMKYVGDKHFDANFSLVSGTNPVREWDASNGVFIVNPDGAAEGKSGVTTYLNQFGRTGTLGQYKTNDPVGELYYESLRYLQGLAPTSQAISGMTATLKDGFPVTETWTDPHPAVTGMTDYSCIRNNIVGIGDVNTHADKSVPGNSATTSNDFARTADVSANLPDIRYWTKIVGAFEEGRSESYADGKGVSRNTSNFNTANPITPDLEDKTPGCCNNNSYLMAGAAYWANTHDIRGTQWTDTAKRRPGMRVSTYILDVNEYAQQTAQSVHKNNQFFLASKYGGFRDRTGTGNPFKSYESGSSTIIDSNENWERGSTGEAKNYFLSSSAKEVLSALDEIFKNIAEEANSIAGGAISTQRLTSVGGYIYQAQFDPADWSGDLLAYPVAITASGTGVEIGQAASSVWKNAANQSVGAAGKLDDITNLSTRKIYVGQAGATTAAAFQWANIDANTKIWLRTPAGAASSTQDSAAVGESRLNYLRGDRASEAGTGAGTLRKRGSRLGDIVNSGVAFSGAPAEKLKGTTFHDTYKDRKKALFVGANDGMLHAFDADTGTELFAYIPSWLVPNLSALTSTSYTHRSYLDGSPTVAEADVYGQGWKTVLVSGTGGGGQGVFALDVSDPNAFDASKVMWEFTDKDDPAMGNVIGRAQIVKLRRSAPGVTPAVYRYYALVASGVNNYVDDGRWSDGNPSLFLLDLSKAPTDTWTLNTNYYRIDFPLNATSIASGMANFTTRLGFAEELAYLYAGDLHGNMWKLDFTKVGATGWNMTDLSFFKSGTSPAPMFVANSSSGDANRQPITMAPSLVFGEQLSIIVSFGTGKFLEAGDTASPYKAQSVYALLDNNLTTTIGGRTWLQAGTASSTGVAVDNFAWGRPATASDLTKRAGWYFDFYNSATSGERQISGFALLAGQLVFGTVIPAENSCDNGKGNLYIVNVMTGDGSSDVSSVGILGEPFITQVGASTVSNSDTTGLRRESARFQVILQGSSGLAAPPSLSRVETLPPPGRLSWREISNYQELRNAP